MTFTPNVPIANAGLMYVNGLTTGTTPGSSIMSVSAGAARDSDNIGDIILENYTDVSGNHIGANGMDVAVIAPNQLYGVFVIGDSKSYKPGAIILSLATGAGLVLPQGYDMSRRIGWAASDSVASPGTGFLKWYHFGSGQTRKYYYDIPLQIQHGNVPTGYALLPNTLTPSPGFALPPINSTVILTLYYAPVLPSSVSPVALFAPYGSPAGAGSGAIVKYSPGNLSDGTTTIEVPAIYYASTGLSSFYFRGSSTADFSNIDAIGFYDYL